MIAFNDRFQSDGLLSFFMEQLVHISPGRQQVSSYGNHLEVLPEELWGFPVLGGVTIPFLRKHGPSSMSNCSYYVAQFNYPHVIHY